MDLVTAVGLIAGALTTVSLLPQVTQIWRAKSARDISLKMFVAFAAAFSCGSFTASCCAKCPSSYGME